MGLISLLTGQKKLSRAEYEFVNKRSKELAASLNVMNSTDNLEKFFKNYHAAETSIMQIIEIAGEKTKCIAGESPKDCLESLHRDYITPLRSCLDRYIRKETVRIMGLSRNRMKSAHGVAAIVEEYSQDMPTECVDFARTLVNDMLKKIEKLEAE